MDGDHDDGEHGHQPPHYARDEEQGTERCNGGEDREDDRARNAAGPADGRVNTAPALLALCMDVLAHHHGVIDDDANGENEREERHHVDRHGQPVHHGEGADERHRDSDRHPEREPEIQEEGEGEEDERQADEAVLHQQPETALEDLGGVVPHFESHPGGQRRDDLVLQVLLDRRNDVEHLLVRGPEDLHIDRGPALEASDQVHIAEAVAHLGDVPQAHHGAVHPAEDDDVLEVLLGVVLPGGADAHLLVPGVDASRGKVEGSAPHGGGNVPEGQTQRPQLMKGDLDGDLVVANARRLDVGDDRKLRELVFGAVRQLLERALAHVAEQHQADDALAIGQFADLGALRAGGEGLDPVDLGLDVVQCARDIRAQLEFHRHRPSPLGRRRADLLDVVHPLDLFLDLAQDRLFDLVGRGAGIGDRDDDLVERNLREDLLDEAAQGDEAGRQNEEHEEVGGDPVAGHVGDGAARLLRPVVRRVFVRRMRVGAAHPGPVGARPHHHALGGELQAAQHNRLSFRKATGDVHEFVGALQGRPPGRW